MIEICVFQCPNSICIHDKISCACHIPSISNLFPKIEQRLLFKMVPNMNGFVNRLMTNWTMLRTFQLSLIVVPNVCGDFIFLKLLAATFSLQFPTLLQSYGGHYFFTEHLQLYDVFAEIFFLQNLHMKRF